MHGLPELPAALRRLRARGSGERRARPAEGERRNRGGGRLAGAAAGLVNGLFGGGGGMVLLPALRRQPRLTEERCYPTCVAVMFPVCAASALVYLARGGVPVRAAAPYLTGGLAGGVLGGKLYGRVPSVWLRRLFGAFLLYAGARYLAG